MCHSSSTILNTPTGKIDCFSFLVRLVAHLDSRPTGDQEVAGSTSAKLATLLRGDLIMKYFLRSFSFFR